MTSFAFVLRQTGPDAPSNDGRYEYRVWSRRALPVVAALQRGWVFERAETRTDIYLLGANTLRGLVKLRDGSRLEIKQRGRDHMGLQYWRVAMSQAFPLPPGTLGQLAAALMLPEALPATASLSPAHLLAVLTRHSSKVETRIVRKSRLLFRQGTNRAEIARVGLDNRSWVTVALEDADANSAARAVDTLGLGHLPNQSYEDFLRALPLLIA